MKKKLLFILLGLIGLGMTSCSEESEDDIIWDVAPINFMFYITDTEGHDLLDSTQAGNLVRDISVVYRDKTYPVKTTEEWYAEQRQSATRAILPVFMGLILAQRINPVDLSPDRYRLYFGEFDGTSNVENREVVLLLNGKEQARMAYSNTFRWKKNGEPKIDRHFLLNGKEVAGDYYHFCYTPGKGLEYLSASDE